MAKGAKMPAYEVFIPAADADGFDITAKITAESWMAALRQGLAKMGDPTAIKAFEEYGHQ